MLYGNLQKDAGTQSRDTRFVRDCAIETHRDISQEISQEPFCMEIYRKGAGSRFRDTHFVLEYAGKKTHMDMSQEHTRAIILCGNLQES